LRELASSQLRLAFWKKLSRNASIAFRLKPWRWYESQCSMRCRTILIFGLSLVWLVPDWRPVRAQDSQPSEYQIKAAFIYNFAKFVEWPAKSLPSDDSPLVIGILGENPFHDDLSRVVTGKKVDEHPLVIKPVRTALEATNCHTLFISASEKPRLSQILKALRGASVLTVSEMDGFTEAGGMINFVREGTKVRFRINNEAASRVGLKISSKLLMLAIRPAS
jgi:hypothetical protein